MSKASEMRIRILAKTNGKCGYCGKDISTARWQCDHIVPKQQGGSDDESNRIAACARCNNWKLVHSVDGFRQEIQWQFDRQYRNSNAFRLAADFGIVQKGTETVQFYFEGLKP